MRIIVCGCRDFDDAKLLNHVLDNIWQDAGYPELTIVHGAARGADSLAKAWALSDLTQHVGAVSEEPHPAAWDTEGKRAGPLRNVRMARLGADLCVAFWDGVSPGTRHMIAVARGLSIPVRIVALTRTLGTLVL